MCLGSSGRTESEAMMVFPVLSGPNLSPWEDTPRTPAAGKDLPRTVSLGNEDDRAGGGRTENTQLAPGPPSHHLLYKNYE